MKRLASLGISLVMILTLAAAAGASENRNFVAVLSGGEEVPANASFGRGAAVFQLSPDGSSLSFRLIASNIENITAAHIHVAPVGVNGSVVAFLYGSVAAGGGRHDGVLSTGTITEANLVGPLAGMTMDDLVAAMRAGNTYVNVHTNDGIAPTGTGPGDLPAGEIRGQIR